MEESITKPSITRLARRSGVKSMSEDCIETVRNLVHTKLEEILNIILVINSERQTKTLMVDDVYEALKLIGHNVTESSCLGASHTKSNKNKDEKTDEEEIIEESK